MSFRFSYYFLTAEREKSPIEVFFNKIQHKIDLYERHTITTNNIYIKSKEEEISKLIEQHKKATEKAKKLYASIVEGSTLENEANNHAIAIHETRIDELDHYHDQDILATNEFYEEMMDNFFKVSLIGIYALLESETKNLCNHLQVKFNLKISSTDLNSRDYFKSSKLYFEKVIDMPVSNLTQFENKFSDLQKLRNHMVHSSGEISENKKILLEIIKRSAGQLTLINEADLPVTFQLKSTAYLETKYNEVRNFFRELLLIIDEKLNHEILLSRLKLIFGVMGNYIDIEITKPTFSVDPVIQGTVFSKISEMDSFQFYIQFTRNKNFRIKVINNIPLNKKIATMVSNIECSAKNIWDDFLIGFRARKFIYSVLITINKVNPK